MASESSPSGSAPGPAPLPPELAPYLSELVHRTRAVCGTHPVSVLAVGSVALGDYRHGRSDVDVTLVVDPSLPRAALPELVAALSHPALPCPAAGLELTVYDADFAGRPSAEAGYLLDLNTGPELPGKVSFDASESPAFWYVLDRSVAARAGRSLHGRPAREAVAEPDRRAVLRALVASVREHADGDGHLSDNRVLNGCRSVVFCRTGRWYAKREAGRALAGSEPAFRPLIEEALSSFDRPRHAARPLPPGAVHDFLTWTADHVAAAAARAEDLPPADPREPWT
ncbi:aminoglycoside adenylyltransferase domain-containing protein [Streptomyces sp. bgisy022]|uniref:aminoglycoside adenylyltransferase domain-containing protein n=1 Tax=Streptomyces sp. bgisy022 TaxID=3413769 RepID=UPI003D721BD4